MPTIVRPDTSDVQQSKANLSPELTTLMGRGNILTGQALKQEAEMNVQSSAGAYNANVQLSEFINQEGATKARRADKEIVFAQQVKASETAKLNAKIEAENNRLFQESKKATQAATLINKMSDATGMFIKGQSNRYKKVVDENGNPTFETLPEDIGNIGNSVMQDLAKDIADPEVARQFILQFSEFVANQKVSALKHSLKSQVEYGRNSVTRGLENLINQSVGDDITQVVNYEQQGLEALQSAYEGGLISVDEYDDSVKNFKTGIRSANIENLIRTDSATASKVLESSDRELGITQGARDDLVRRLNGKLESEQIEYAKASKIKRIDNLAEEAMIIHEVQSKIDADVMNVSDLQSLEGKISPKRFEALKDRYLKVTSEKMTEREALHNTASKLANGNSISDVSPKDVNKFFEYTVQQRADITGKDVPLSEQAQLAGMIPAEVKSFAGKLESSVKFGNSETAQEVLSAYSYLKDKNAPTLNNSFDDDATAIMEHTQLLVEKGGLNPGEALVSSRDLILNKKDDTQKERVREFNKIKAFNSSNIEELAASELPGAEGMFGGNRISSEAVDTFKSFVKDGYLKTGNQDTAVAYAKSLMGKTHGVSEISGSKQFMYSPPEKMFPAIAPESLRGALLEDVSPELPMGVDAKSISVQSDTYTNGRVFIAGTQNGQKVQQNVPSWIVTYVKDIDGVEMTLPLLDATTGKPKRWTPIGSSYLSNIDTARDIATAAKLEEARLLNEGFRIEQPQ